MVTDLQAELLQVSVCTHLMKGPQLYSAEQRDQRGSAGMGKGEHEGTSPIGGHRLPNYPTSRQSRPWKTPDEAAERKRWLGEIGIKTRRSERRG